MKMKFDWKKMNEEWACVEIVGLCFSLHRQRELKNNKYRYCLWGYFNANIINFKSLVQSLINIDAHNIEEAMDMATDYISTKVFQIE